MLHYSLWNPFDTCQGLLISCGVFVGGFPRAVKKDSSHHVMVQCDIAIVIYIKTHNASCKQHS